MALLPPGYRSSSKDFSAREVIKELNTDTQAVISKDGKTVLHGESALANIKEAGKNIAEIFYPADLVRWVKNFGKDSGESGWLLYASVLSAGIVPIVAWGIRALVGVPSATKNTVDAARHGARALFGVDTALPPKILPPAPTSAKSNTPPVVKDRNAP